MKLRIGKAPSILLVFPLALLAGCAGRDFFRPPEDTLVLGKTTYDEIIQACGQPEHSGSLMSNDRVIRSITYVYAAELSPSHAPGVIAARAMSFSFVGETLVGYGFSSSFAADHSDFDDSKVSEIRKGETTREQVLALLGPPGGKAIFPITKSREDQGMDYQYGQLRVERTPFSKTTFHRSTKQLFVSINPQGVVTDVVWAASGER